MPDTGLDEPSAPTNPLPSTCLAQLCGIYAASSWDWIKVLIFIGINMVDLWQHLSVQLNLILYLLVWQKLRFVEVIIKKCCLITVSDLHPKPLALSSLLFNVETCHVCLCVRQKKKTS